MPGMQRVEWVQVQDIAMVKLEQISGAVPPKAMDQDERGQLLARLSSNGQHVVCGIRDCGARLAQVFIPTARDIAEAETNGGAALACIQFLPGWAPRLDGSWAFSRYAKLRRRRRQSLKVRRYPQDNGTIYNDVMPSYYDPLPARAKCSNCDMVNVLTTTKLGAPRILRVPAEPVPRIDLTQPLRKMV